jgi:hypothetical protein
MAADCFRFRCCCGLFLFETAVIIKRDTFDGADPGAAAAAGAFGVVDDGEVVLNDDRLGGAFLFTFAAGDTAF